MAIIKFKSGLETNRSSIIPQVGEIIYTTDTKKVYIGDNSTPGGISINQSSAEILAKILTVDGSGSGLDGDLIDGILGSNLLRSDQDGTLVGELTVNDKLFFAITQTPNSNSVVDVFLYDTSKDSDGGAWRKRTQHTSWYNETLNTTTRGATKEFPTLALIVAEVDKITIYDATDSSCPMWMVFNQQNQADSKTTGSGGMVNGGGVRSVSFLNGYLCIGCTSTGISNTPTGLDVINFISDGAIAYSTITTRSGVFTGDISDRNGLIGAWSIDNPNFIADEIVNDVAMTILPNAPIDTETGLPIPTIAVATNGGISIIHNNDSVVDLTYIVGASNESGNVEFVDDGIIWTSRLVVDKYVYIQKLNNIPYSDVTGAPDAIYRNSGNGSFPEYLGKLGGSEYYVKHLVNNNVGNDLGLTLFKKDIPHSNSMVNYITKDYTSGWMQGDIKGAFLANSKINDRSPNDNSITEIGTVIESPVATGSELMAYSGFSGVNYLEQTYNSDLDFGTGDFYIMGWFNSSSGALADLFNRGLAGSGLSDSIRISLTSTQHFRITLNNQANSLILPYELNVNNFFVAKRQNGLVTIYLNNNQSISDTVTDNIGAANHISRIGLHLQGINVFTGSLSLFRIGASAPSDDQIQDIYESERHLFKENSKCTLSSSTSVVNALSYNEDTNLLHVAGSDNLDTFDGLIRTNSETGVYTSISNNNGVAVKGN